VRRWHCRFDERLTSYGPLIGGCLVCDTLYPASSSPDWAPNSPRRTGLTGSWWGTLAAMSEGPPSCSPRVPGKEEKTLCQSPPYKQNLSRPFHTLPILPVFNSRVTQSTPTLSRSTTASIDDRQVSCVKERSPTTRIFPTIKHQHQHRLTETLLHLRSVISLSVHTLSISHRVSSNFITRPLLRFLARGSYTIRLTDVTCPHSSPSPMTGQPLGRTNSGQ
jgi:hypothetical protein